MEAKSESPSAQTPSSRIGRLIAVAVVILIGAGLVTLALRGRERHGRQLQGRQVDLTRLAGLQAAIDAAYSPGADSLNDNSAVRRWRMFRTCLALFASAREGDELPDPQADQAAGDDRKAVFDLLALSEKDAEWTSQPYLSTCIFKDYPLEASFVTRPGPSRLVRVTITGEGLSVAGVKVGDGWQTAGRAFGRPEVGYVMPSEKGSCATIAYPDFGVELTYRWDRAREGLTELSGEGRVESALEITAICLVDRAAEPVENGYKFSE